MPFVLVILLPSGMHMDMNCFKRLRSLPFTMIKSVPQQGPPDLSNYLGIIGIWSLIQYDFVIYINQKSVILNGLELL